MKPIKEPLLVCLLRFAAERVPDGTTYEEAYAHLQCRGFLTLAELHAFSVPKSERSEAIAHKKRRIDWFIAQALPANLGGEQPPKRHVSLDAYFHLLEYDELQEARRYASSARVQSTWAICISLLAVIVSMATAYYQSRQSVTIDELQFKALVGAARAGAAGELGTMSAAQRSSSGAAAASGVVR
jgi:hypothetical protein